MEGPFNKAICRGGRMKISSILILLIVVFVLLAWGGISLYRKGYAAAEAIYQQKAVASAMTKIENTETLECKKIELKQRERNLDADCKALYNTNLSACRRQLLGKH